MMRVEHVMDDDGGRVSDPCFTEAFVFFGTSTQAAERGTRNTKVNSARTECPLNCHRYTVIP